MDYLGDFAFCVEERRGGMLVWWRLFGGIAIWGGGWGGRGERGGGECTWVLHGYAIGVWLSSVQLLYV